MLKPHYLLFLMSLLQDGGVAAPAIEPSRALLLNPAFPASGGDCATDGGSAQAPLIAEGIQWPEDLRPLATLEGPAVLAAHAALQRVLSTYPKEYAQSCAFSAKGLEVIVGEERGIYFVRINPRPDKCGWAPGTVLGFDVFELYAVSPEGQILARHPSLP